jgi:hypothetical protein
LSQNAGDQQLILGKNKNYAIQQRSTDIYHCKDKKRYFSVACFEKN